ncbi:MAG TPA: hypothetical protein DDW66_04290 [Porphyromonadaceae bacterium]|jgi:hypothetical protein|nr:hypothetical protein [Porphyromonadaceae bacterium]
MNEERQHQLFRLSAVLYADNNYEVVPKTIHRKVIESALLECGMEEYSVHQIIDFIQERYSITFDEESVREIVTSKKEEGFLTNHRNGNLYVCLSEKRKQTLQAKISNKTIDFFISEFQGNNTQLVARVDSKAILYKFLYDIFSTNTYSFQKLINNKKDLSGIINLENSNYSEKEKEIINNFLQWDNFEKNKAIFNIASYALEYCMLTNKNGSSSIHLDNLKNKSFYLDTNIIYRVLGINGENRQKRSKTFLKKFNDSGEKIIISKSTETEFKDGIKGHVDRIRNYDSPRVNSILFQEVEVQRDIYNFYHKWRIGKINYNLDLFIAEIYSIYDNFKKEFKIQVDTVKPFDINDKKVDELLKNYTSSISTFKQNEGNEIIGSATIDAENILWIEMKRENKVQNIFDTKYFFISSDQSLRRWDYQREDKTPIVLLPSQWMSILLRYLNRTEDDFKSFVSFLNLKNSEVLINSEKLHIVLTGIAEMTTSIEQQRFILNNLVENKFNSVVSRSMSNEQIFENAKKYAKSKLENEVEKLKIQNNDLTGKYNEISADITVHKTAVTSEIQHLKDEKEGIKRKLSDKEKENIHLKEQLIESEIKAEMRKWQEPAKWLIALGFLIILFMTLQFCCKTWSLNYPYKLVMWIETITNTVQKTTLTTLMYAPLIGLWLISKFVWSRLISKDKKSETKLKIKNNVTVKYK